MAEVKIIVWLDDSIAETLMRRATESGMPVNHFLCGLIQADAEHAQDVLASEGYRSLSQFTDGFASAALPLALETWPDWPSAADP